MRTPLQFIANSLYDVISRIRDGGTSLDAKRPRVWDEYGYPGDVSFDQLYQMWRRHGIAHGIVEKMINRCWSTDPWLLEGTKSQDDRPETPWEKRMRQYAAALKLWSVFAEADRRRMIGGCSALLLEAPGAWNEPIRRGAVVSVTAAWRNDLHPAERDMVTGRVRSWNYKGKAVIHPDRLFLLGDWDDPIGFLEPCYNSLLNLDKVTGGAAEGFLKNAARQLAIEFDSGTNLQALAQAYGKKPEELQEVFDQMARDVNTGVDAMLGLQGAKVTPLVAALPDPAAPFDVNLQMVSASTGIPAKIIVGNQTGERASSEDLREFNGLCQSRLDSLLLGDVREFFEHLARIRAIEPLPTEWSVEGPDLTEAGTGERLTNAKLLTDMNKASELSGPLFTAAEIRTAAGYDAEPEEPAGGDGGQGDNLDDLDE
ncbi:hypothetical protein D3C78_298080 [compost metagenome]